MASHPTNEPTNRGVVPVNSDSLSLDGEWDEPDGTALADLARELTQASLLKPITPRSLIPELRTSVDGWAWSTDSDLDSMGVYSIFGEAGPPQLEVCLADNRGDSWMFGHRGHGINSYGIGLVARVGPLFIAHQSGWGGAYMGPEDTDQVDAATQSWNATLESLEGCHDDDLEVAVLFSNYRAYAMLLVRDPTNTASSTSSEIPPGWSPLYANDRHDISTLHDLHFADESAVALGAAHLSCLVAAQTNLFGSDE